mmetsp:Transcript_20576/g.22030  ORF Transcript_20576/g.22030 Transcript_20576/m.22030 type:complete len:443 (-) Transcript_20576:339-1667(-)
MSSTMSCSSCATFTSIHNLVRVYGMTWNDSRGSGSNPLIKVCGRCLIGYHIPALRKTGWELGTVQTYDSLIQMHQIVFTDDAEEWVFVENDPFEAYVQQFEDSDSSGERSSGSVKKGFPLFMTNSVNGNQFDAHSNRTILNEHQYPLSPINTKFPSVQALSIVANSSCIHLKEKASIDFSIDQFHHSPITQHSPKMSVMGSDSPTSQVSTVSISSTTTTSNIGPPSRIPKLWTLDEDQLLLGKIAAINELCWPTIALEIPGRTGKQCRERFLNHLSSKLKKSGWTACEDSTIFRLYDLHGSKWSLMARVLPGRTDNGIKNRYHHLKRRFEKRMQSVPDSKGLGQLMKNIGESPAFQSLSLDPFVVRYIAAVKGQNSNDGDGEYKFGPFYPVEKSFGCGRCGLFIPSKETGRLVCSRTGWCKTCTDVTLVLSGDLLRAIHLPG